MTPDPSTGPSGTPLRPHTGVLHFDERKLDSLQSNSWLFTPGVHLFFGASGGRSDATQDVTRSKPTFALCCRVSRQIDSCQMFVDADATRSVGMLGRPQRLLDHQVLSRQRAPPASGGGSFIRDVLKTPSGQRNTGVPQLGDTRDVPLWTQVWSCCGCSEETGSAPPQPGGAVTLWRTALHRLRD